MNDFLESLPPSRDRGKTLLIVEGELEEKTFYNLFKVYPEIRIDDESIIVYKSNIYDLYRKIENEYGKEWFSYDIDLPLIVGRDKGQVIDEKDVTYKIIVFDFEPQDTFYDSSKITSLLTYFNNATDNGKLYINYPMVESAFHFSTIPDVSYYNRSVTMDVIRDDYNTGGYKNIVKTESAILNHINLYDKILQELRALRLENEEVKSKFSSLINTISLNDRNHALIYNSVKQVLGFETPDSTQNQVLNKIASFFRDYDCLGIECQFVSQSIRKLYNYIISESIHKSVLIQNDYLKLPYDENCQSIEPLKILEKQIFYLENKNLVQVLNMSLLIVPDYNSNLILDDK